MKKQQPLDAALFYLAMKKQSLLKTLFKYVLQWLDDEWFATYINLRISYIKCVVVALSGPVLSAALLTAWGGVEVSGSR